MKPQDGADLMEGKILLGAAATGWFSTIGTLLNYIPIVLGIVVSLLSAILLVVLIRKRILEGKILSLDLQKKEREEKKKEEESEAACRVEQGLDCRRHGDKKHIEGN